MQFVLTVNTASPYEGARGSGKLAPRLRAHLLHHRDFTCIWKPLDFARSPRKVTVHVCSPSTSVSPPIYPKASSRPSFCVDGIAVRVQFVICSSKVVPVAIKLTRQSRVVWRTSGYESSELSRVRAEPQTVMTEMFCGSPQSLSLNAGLQT